MKPDVEKILSGWAISFYDYIVPSENGVGFQCTECGKQSNDKSNLHKHVESIHFPGTFVYNCKFCSEVCTTRNLLNMHVRKMHHGRKV